MKLSVCIRKPTRELQRFAPELGIEPGPPVQGTVFYFLTIILSSSRTSGILVIEVDAVS